jgi:hypothetical protein
MANDKTPEHARICSVEVGAEVCTCGCGTLPLFLTIEGVGTAVCAVDFEMGKSIADAITRPFLRHHINQIIAEVETHAAMQRAAEGPTK